MVSYGIEAGFDAADAPECPPYPTVFPQESLSMRILTIRYALFLGITVGLGGCGRQPAQQPAPAATPPPAPAAHAESEPPDDAGPAPTVRSAEALAKLMPSNAAGCAPGARCIKATANGRPSNSETSIAQCRGEFADFIVPKSTIPAGYSGPWFQPNKIEEAHTGVPSGTRPWRNLDPRQEPQRLAYLTRVAQLRIRQQ